MAHEDGSPGTRRCDAGGGAARFAGIGGAAQAGCGADGSTYAPRPPDRGDAVRHRLTTLAMPPGAPADVGGRWRFDLSDARRRHRPSRLDLDYVCGMGRASCAVWPLGTDDADSPFHSVATMLNADLSPAIAYGAPYAIVFANSGEAGWLPALQDRAVPGVRYFTAARVPPDLSGRAIWVRIGCGRDTAGAAARGRAAATGSSRSTARR